MWYTSPFRVRLNRGFEPKTDLAKLAVSVE